VTIHPELRFQQKSVDHPRVIIPWPQKRNNSDLQAYELSSLKINFPPLLYFGAAEFLDYNRSGLYRVFINIQFTFRLRYTRLNFEAFAAVKIRAVVFWTVTPCSRVDGYQHIEVPHFQGRRWRQCVAEYW